MYKMFQTARTHLENRIFQPCACFLISVTAAVGFTVAQSIYILILKSKMLLILFLFQWCWIQFSFLLGADDCSGAHFCHWRKRRKTGL